MKLPKVLRDIHRNSDPSPFIDTCFIHPTGSAYTCNPPVTDTDEDWLLWTIDVPDAVFRLEADGYVTSERQEEYPDCCSYRKGNINIILVCEKEGFINWRKATEICRQLNLLRKEDRVIVHRLLSGENPIFDYAVDDE